MFVMRCLGLAGIQMHGTTVPTGQFLRSYDPEDNTGYGQADFTSDIALAKKFETSTEAFETYTAIPSNRPLRDDGKKNRPLMAYTMEILPEDQA